MCTRVFLYFLLMLNIKVLKFSSVQQRVCYTDGHSTRVLEGLFATLVYGWQVATRNSCGSGSPLGHRNDWMNRIKREVSVLDGSLLLLRSTDPVILPSAR